MIFPGNRVNNKMTINGARGCNRIISDRFDLTIECVRRYYLNQSSPLGETLSRYSDFFALFRNFEGYVNFFLLQDLVEADNSTVKFFMPFDDFKTPSVPKTVEEYVEFRWRSIAFIEARNRRIDKQLSLLASARLGGDSFLLVLKESFDNMLIRSLGVPAGRSFIK